MGLIRARVRKVTTTVRDPHPLAQALSARLAQLLGSDLNGTRGRIRIGNTAAINGRKITGYVAPPQNYAGAGRLRQGVDGGAIRAGIRQGGLPGTQAPFSESSPLLAQIAAAQNPAYGGKKK
jgi:hypothetical protein